MVLELIENDYGSSEEKMTFGLYSFSPTYRCYQNHYCHMIYCSPIYCCYHDHCYNMTNCHVIYCSPTYCCNHDHIMIYCYDHQLQLLLLCIDCIAVDCIAFNYTVILLYLIIQDCIAFALNLASIVIIKQPNCINLFHCSEFCNILTLTS